MYRCEITSDQLETRLTQIEKDVAGLRARPGAAVPPAACYVNWSAEHQALRAGAYVAREELLAVLDKFLLLHNFYYVVKQGEADRLLRAPATHAVTQHSRFPPHGVHVDVAHIDVYLKLLNIRETFADANQLACGSVVEGLEMKIRSLQSVLSREVGDEGTSDVLYDRDAFEAAHGLLWA